MIKTYKKLFPATLGIFLSLVCVVALAEFFKSFDILYLEEPAEYVPFLLIAIFSGFSGIPLALNGIEKLSKP